MVGNTPFFPIRHVFLVHRLFFFWRGGFFRFGEVGARWTLIVFVLSSAFPVTWDFPGPPGNLPPDSLRTSSPWVLFPTNTSPGLFPPRTPLFPVSPHLFSRTFLIRQMMEPRMSCNLLFSRSPPVRFLVWSFVFFSLTFFTSNFNGTLSPLPLRITRRFAVVLFFHEFLSFSRCLDTRDRRPPFPSPSHPPLKFHMLIPLPFFPQLFRVASFSLFFRPLPSRLQLGVGRAHGDFPPFFSVRTPLPSLPDRGLSSRPLLFFKFGGEGNDTPLEGRVLGVPLRIPLCASAFPRPKSFSAQSATAGGSFSLRLEATS